MHDNAVKSYFIRRFLLVPPTLVGVTLLVFAITRFVPGGAIDRMLQESARGADAGGGRKGVPNESLGGMSEEQMEALEERYALDKPIVYAYLQWVGLLPRENSISKAEFGAESGERIDTSKVSGDTTEVILHGDGRAVLVTHEGGGKVKAVFAETGKPVASEGWKVRYEDNAARQARFKRRNPEVKEVPEYAPRAVVYQTRFAGLLQGDLGRSQIYNEPVLDMVLERVPIAAYFGILTAIITYGVSLPLGVLKALRHRTFLDSASSVLIFIGYSIPGFALGALMLVYLGARMNLFPLAGFTSADFPEMEFWGKVKDLVHHTTLPMVCYVVGSFAMLTMLTKNNLMDNLATDYVRTAVAKGAGYYRAVFGHAFRNSMIPVATSLGNLISVFVGGSMLIEKVFDIQGFGLLQFHAVLDRDVNVIMGTLLISATLMLIGNILSDIIVAMVDPRIKFE